VTLLCGRRVADGEHRGRCRLAVWLQANGAGPEKIVPIYMGRQIEYVVAYIAILKVELRANLKSISHRCHLFICIGVD